MIDKPVNAPLLRPGSVEDVKNFFRILIVGVIAVVFFLQSFSDQTVKTFWETIDHLSPSDIERIEVQRLKLDQEVGSPILITDQAAFVEFVSAVQTDRKHPFFDRRFLHAQDEMVIKLFIIDKKARDLITNKRTLELKCSTTLDYPKNVFVSTIGLKPGIITHGNGDTLFTSPKLYDWLSNHGVLPQR